MSLTSTESSMSELRIDNDAIEDAAELRQRIATTGYVFFKSLQDTDRLRSLRRDIFGVMMEGGWLRAGTPIEAGIANIDSQCTEGDLEYTEVYHQVQRLQSFHRSGHWPEVLDVMGKIIDDVVLPHPQKICRLWFPQYTEHTTPTHQDYVHFQGSYDTYTCWAPIGDCPRQLGGLAILPGSHEPQVVKPHHFSLGAGLLAIDDDDLSGQWQTTDYEIGDTLIFHSLLAHRALPNDTEEQMRISLDNRYQSASIPISEQMLTPHLSGFSPLSWDDVYAEWDAGEFQYYWKDHDLEVMPKQMQWANQAHQEVLERAAEGDAHAAHHLRRIVRHDPDSEQGQQARQILETSGLL